MRRRLRPHTCLPVLPLSWALGLWPQPIGRVSTLLATSLGISPGASAANGRARPGESHQALEISTSAR